MDDKSASTDMSGARASNSSSKRTPRVSKPASSNSAKAAEAAALRKQREEDRRKLMEQRRWELKQKKLNEEDTAVSKDTVEIFGAQPR